MSMAKNRSHIDDVLMSLQRPEEVAQFTEARRQLKTHLIHTREILNGKDFLFSGPSPELHAALKGLVAIEHRYSRFLQFDYAQIDEYFLLRVVGLEKHLPIIESYFE